MASESQEGRFKRLTLVRNSMGSNAGILQDGFCSAGWMHSCSGSCILWFGLARHPVCRHVNIYVCIIKRKYDPIQNFTRSSRNETKLEMSSWSQRSVNWKINQASLVRWGASSFVGKSRKKVILEAVNHRGAVNNLHSPDRLIWSRFRFHSTLSLPERHLERSEECLIYTPRRLELLTLFIGNRLCCRVSQIWAKFLEFPSLAL